MKRNVGADFFGEHAHIESGQLFLLGNRQAKTCFDEGFFLYAFGHVIWRIASAQGDGEVGCLSIAPASLRWGKG
jgi:hypothetical protein